jgi:predicted  nucleic acid-binding Zn-ribbon protein
MFDHLGLLESTLAIIISLGAIMGFVWKSLTARIDRDLKDAKDDLEKETKEREDDIKDVRHDLKNLATKQDALDRSHNDAVNRIVRVETDITSIKVSTARIDQTMGEIAKSLRERP